MAQVEYIAEKDAPAPPKPLSKSAAETLRIIQSIPEGKVAKVTPDEGQTLRGLKTSFSRVASSRNVKIQTWSLEGDNFIYVKKLK